MRLLIVTQVVDRTHPILGFFHEWIKTFSGSLSRIEVITLYEGEHSLPDTVAVHSLGKEFTSAVVSNSIGRKITYSWRFLRLAWKLRGHYDAVFVHMNQEYVLLAGWLWKLLGKRIYMWRNHSHGTLLTDAAGFLSDAVFCTSSQAYVATFPHAQLMPIGINTTTFSPAETLPLRTSILFFGRLDKIKNPHLLIEAVRLLNDQGIDCAINIYGDPSDSNSTYAPMLKQDASDMPNIRFHDGVPPSEAPAIFRAHSIYVNLTPSGSFDKTIGEAMASGCVPVVVNIAIQRSVPEECFVLPEPQSIAQGIQWVLALSKEDSAAISKSAREFVVQKHSLELLHQRLCETITTHARHG